MRMLLMVWPFMTTDATHVLRVNVILSGPLTDRHVALMEVGWSSLWVSLPADPDFGVCTRRLVICLVSACCWKGPLSFRKAHDIP